MTNRNLIATSPKNISPTTHSRGLSPIRSPPNASPMMHSPRTSPVIRPRSPLSPRYESSPRFETMRPTSPRNMTTRTDMSQRRPNANGLKLPALPRFHPSNFPSAQSSHHGTPDSSHGSPGPTSPRIHQRVISDAQKHLLAYQREMMSAAARASTPTQLDNPESPRLLPLGSPTGPVTPLQLEVEDSGYVTAGIRGRGRAEELISPDELVERLVKEEAARQWRNTSLRQSKR